MQAIVDRVLIQTVNTPSSYWQWLPGGMSPGEPIKKRMIDATIDDVPADIRARIEKTCAAGTTTTSASWTSTSRS